MAYPQEERYVNNRFRIMDTLGLGHSGKVKRAEDTAMRMFVALKILDTFSEDDPASPRRRNRLQREVQANDLCSGHPNVVSFYEAMYNVEYPKRNGERVRTNILVQELCEMGELFGLLRGDPVPWVVCQDYFRQMMAGIKHCHDMGVCHRDLKPENLLLDANFCLKIADFGFAASTDSGCKTMAGSLVYMAPEVLARRNRRYVDEDSFYDGAKADVWSSGLILFTMFAGHPPLDMATDTDWWFRSLKLGELDLFWESHEQTAPEFPGEAKDLISRMLCVNPDHRISVDEIMRHPFLHRDYNTSVSYGNPLYGREVMRARYEYYMPMGHQIYVMEDDARRRTADYAGVEISGSPSTVTPTTRTAALQGHRVPRAHGELGRPVEIFDQETVRAPLVSTMGVPTMTEDDAAKVTRGFVAFGPAKDIVQAMQRELLDMGAKIDGVNEEGLEEFLETFEVTAVIRHKGKWKGSDMGLCARVFRVLPGADVDVALDAPEKHVVVLWKTMGDFHRYVKVVDTLVSSLTD